MPMTRSRIALLASLIAIIVFGLWAWPRTVVWVALLSHDVLARELMSDGWLAEARSSVIPIDSIRADELRQDCRPDETIEWSGLQIGFDSQRLQIGEAPSASSLRLVSDGVELTIWESPHDTLLQPITDHPNLAKQYDALFADGNRLDVLVRAYEAAERSPFFTSASAHFKREWLARLKATTLRVGADDGLWIAEHDGFTALIPRGTPRVIGIDLYVPEADRFIDVTIRGVNGPEEANELLSCLRVE